MAEPKVIKTTEEKLSSVEEQIEKKKTEISLGQKRLRDLQKERDKLIKQKGTQVEQQQDHLKLTIMH